MTSMSSPGVYVQERDTSQIVPTTSNSVTVFAGDFQKGIVNKFTQITSVDDLVEHYGKPTNSNYNDWYQAYNFLQYGNNLLISRAVNINGAPIATKSTYQGSSSTLGYGNQDFGISNYGYARSDDLTVVNNGDDISKGDIIVFSDNVVNAIDETQSPRFYVIEVYETASNGETVRALKLDRDLESPDGDTETDAWFKSHNRIYKIQVHHNGSCEALSYGNAEDVVVTWKTTTQKYQEYERGKLVNKNVITTYNIPFRVANYLEGTPFVTQSKETSNDITYYTALGLDFTKYSDAGLLFNTNTKILNPEDFDNKFDSLAFAKPSSKLKFFSKTPGTLDAKYQISIALPSDFSANDKEHVGNHCTRYAQPGLAIDGYFEYPPQTGTAQIAVFIYDTVDNIMKETFLCSLDPDEYDSYNNSMFIEKIINRQSNCVYVKCDTSSEPLVETTVSKFDVYGNIISSQVEKVPNVESYTFVADKDGECIGRTLSFSCASDSTIQADDLLNAYEVFENKDTLDIDIIIANELDNGNSAKSIAEKREDCIAYLGIPYEDEDLGILTVGKKTATATNSIVEFRNKLGYNSMWLSLVANYKYQYDRYGDTYRWVNVSGDVAGLRAQTNEDYDPWWASAGLNRGQIKNVTKLAYTPNKTQVGTLYNNNVNTIVDFQGDGYVLWGQKTMLTSASSFDRVNVRCLFNVIERALAKMSRYQVMEFNDSYTRANVTAKITPYLDTVKANRGVADFKVICDESNNTADIISRNQLICDVYIKPNYVAEFILLRFTNAGVNDFSTVISNA